MPGSLKVTCATGTRAFASTAAFGTLNNQSNFTFSGWYEIASIGSQATNCDLIACLSGYPFSISIGNITTIQYQTHNNGNTQSIIASKTLDNRGHFVVVSYNATGRTSIYVDGAEVAHFNNIGNTPNSNQTLNVGFNSAGAAVAIYEKDVGIWANFSATQLDVIALRDGIYTPGTLVSSATGLLTPASNWWSLQGNPGAVSINNQGLIDTIGGVNLGTITGTGGSSTLTYDAHEIVLTHSVDMMPVYCDTTGTFIIAPLYLDPIVTLGGPTAPTAINVVPTFKKNGVTITPTLIPVYSQLYAIMYEVDHTDPILAGDVVTMSAPMGWASTAQGLVAGTSTDGTQATPLVVVNNTGLNVESIYVYPKTMRIGWDVSASGNANNYPGQPRANHVSRILGGSDGWTNLLTAVTSGNSNGLPLTISAPSRAALYGNPGNNVDANGTPGTAGLWTLTYGDSSIGVSGSAPNLTIALSAAASWQFVETNVLGVTSSGHWDGSAWHGITKCYMATYGGAGTTGTSYGLGLAVTITSTNGNVGFPSMGNGQVEFGVFPPSPTNRNVSSPINWDPLGIDPEYLLKMKGAYCVRWMPDLHGFQGSGGSSTKLIGDLTAYRQVNDFLWTTQNKTVVNITKAEPLSSPLNVVVDYQGTTQLISTGNWNAASLYERVPYLLTTDGNHNLRTGDIWSVSGLSGLPALSVKQDNLLLTGGGITDGVSTGPWTVSETNTLLAVNQIVQIDSEQLTILTVSGNSITASRGTAGTTGAAHLAGAAVYTNFLTTAIGTNSGTHAIVVSRTAGLAANAVIQIDSEQMVVTSVDSATGLHVTQAQNGTTGATHSIGAIVHPCVVIGISPPCMVVNSTQFIANTTNAYNPFGGPTAISNPTIAATVNYTAPNQPIVTVTHPNNNGSVPYEFAANTTNAIATANGRETVLWINFDVMVTDAVVTDVISNRTIPYIGPNVKVVCELGNEDWNASGEQFYLACILYSNSPNPDTGVAAYQNSQEWVASRQNYITNLAKAAFTGAGLDPGRVFDFQPGQHQASAGQGTSAASLIYCQEHGTSPATSMPVDLLTIDGYVDITTLVWTLFWGWMPVADGGGSLWHKIDNTHDRAWARRVMMSYLRVWWWFSAAFGGAILANSQLLSWYKAGKSVRASGVGSAAANTGLGKLCFYESATELLASNTDGSGFLKETSMQNDLINDGLVQWPGDTGWGATETAYLMAKQSAAEIYSDVMPMGSFPDSTSARAAFTCLFSNIGVFGPNGQGWFTYRYQGQQAGDGHANAMGWDPTNPVENSIVNDSVRAHAALLWMAGTASASNNKRWLHTMSHHFRNRGRF